MVRATPLPPDERRSAIITATIPLVRDRGFDVPTVEIARAAGVAEGTLFRVFPTKADLFDAVVQTVMDPTDDIAALDAIDRSLPLPRRVDLVIDQWQVRIDEVSVLMAAIQTSGGRPRHGHTGARKELGHKDNDRLNSAVARLLEPDAAELRVPPAKAAAFLRSAIFAATHPMLHPGDRLSRDELRTLVLHGLTSEVPLTRKDQSC